MDIQANKKANNYYQYIIQRRCNSGIYSIIIVLITSSMFFCCFECSNGRNKGIELTAVDSVAIMKKLEAREDSLELIKAFTAQSKIEYHVMAVVETEPVDSDLEEDAADDPAIWHNKERPEESLVLGTNKKGGLYVYNLDGKELQVRNAGLVNNVDLRDGFTFNGKEVVLVAASNRSNNSVLIFTLDKENRELSDTLLNVPSKVDEVYGLCCYHNKVEGRFYVFVNGKEGKVEQYRIEDKGGISAVLVREFSVNSQPEGMVADDSEGLIYIGVENEGIFFGQAEPDTDADLSFIEGSDESNVNIRFDIEGLALFTYDGAKYLIASSQGNFSYAVFQLDMTPSYLTSFIIKKDVIDGVEETDGLDIAIGYFSDQFPGGLFVVQDGFNTLDEESENQNFKFIDAREIFAIIEYSSH
jgi:3-phytase